MIYIALSPPLKAGSKRFTAWPWNDFKYRYSKQKEYLSGSQVSVKVSRQFLNNFFLKGNCHKYKFLCAVTDIVSGEFIQGLQNFYRQDILECKYVKVIFCGSQWGYLTYISFISTWIILIMFCKVIGHFAPQQKSICPT